MKQTEAIMQYISDFGSISSMEAFRDLGITRLAARVSDLEDKGICFNRKREKTVTRYGNETYFTRYSIAEKGQNNG